MPRWSLVIVLGALTRGLVVAVDVHERRQSSVEDAVQEQAACPPCNELFSKLETTANGQRVQNTRLQLRGEPKSGTTFMYAWAFGILQRTCQHLRAYYGEGTCHVEEAVQRANMVFEPRFAGGGAPCQCEGVDLVEVSIAAGEKHIFPVSASCPWKHRNGIPNLGEGCWMAGGQLVENRSDLWTCMQESACEFADDRLQFVAMRDPRAVAVSTYFYVRANPRYYEDHPAQTRSLEETIEIILPQVCHWTTLRHILFDGVVANRSELFWYQDALEDPLDWHYRWAYLAGLLLPKSLLERTVESTGQAPWSTKVNVHIGGKDASAKRTWRDEISPSIVDDMNAVLRTWLPSVLLARFEVPP